MARASKKANLKVVGGTGDLSHDNTKNTLSDDDILALTLQHKRKYESALAAKKKASADFLNCTKLIKSELGDAGISDIKDMIAADSDDYEVKLRADLERKARLARWLGLEIGTQANLFAPTQVSQHERGYSEGKRAGLSGDPCKTDFAPGTDGYDGYMKGWHEGQAVNAAQIKKKEADEAPLLRPEGNDSAGADAFDAAADDVSVGDVPDELSDDDADAGDAPEDNPWPDDLAVAAAREPAEVL